MKLPVCAILAVWLLFGSLSHGLRADDLSSPIAVEFRLLDGVRIEGKLSSWDRDGFGGSFGRRQWHEIKLDDARSLFYRLMNRDAATQWVDFGRMLLQHENGGRLADLAFKRAVEIDPSTSNIVTETRAEVAQILQQREQGSKHRDDVRLQTSSPESRAWTAEPWPELSAEEQRTARLSMIADAERLMQNAGIELQSIESEYFLVYFDLDRVDAATLAVKWLDGAYRQIAKAFDVAGQESVFWGKPVVFVFQEDDRFRVFEASMFNQYVRSEQVAITHYEGPKVFISAARQRDDVLMQAALAREVAHAFLHRFISARRLPPWAHEGIAEFFAQDAIERSTIHESQRVAALQLVRGGFPFGTLLLKTWDEDSWNGTKERGYAIVHLFIDYLLSRAPKAFISWVKACKRGDDWREAIVRSFGGDIVDFADAFYRFYRVND